MGRADERRSLDLNKPVKVFDFFCGSGGTSSGLKKSGMEIAFGLDSDPDCASTFLANFPEARFALTDIQAYPTDLLESLVHRWSDHPLLFSACAPCQLFSQQRRGDFSDEDTRLDIVLHVLRFVERYRPEFVFVENVPGLKKRSVSRNVFELLRSVLNQLGYSIDCEIVSSQDYGIPQRRTRFVLLASRIFLSSIPHKTHGPGTRHPAFATVKDWIWAFPPIAAGESHPSVKNHRAARLSALNLKRIRATPAGGSWQDWPMELVPDCHKTDFTGYTDVYGRLRWDAPAPAMTTRCISYSNGRFGHPEQDRAISVREAASLQTFPLDFVFAGNLNSQARQVGNAVPTMLAQTFGADVLRRLRQTVVGGGRRDTF